MGIFLFTSGNVLAAPILLLFLLLSLNIPLSPSLNFHFSTFSPDDAILLEGDAKISTGTGVVQLITSTFNFRVGHITYKERVPVWESSNSGQHAKLADFTTHFSFTLTNPAEPNSIGDGFAFFLAPFGYGIPPNSGDGFLGLFNDTTAFDSSHKPGIVMVEFDTYSNSAPWQDPEYGQHIGINVNSAISIITKPWNATSHNGDIGNVWITYNGTTRNLSVFWSYGGAPNSSLDTIVNITEVLPRFVTIGFSASTGLANQWFELRSWDFSSSLDEGGKTSEGKKIGLVVGGSVGGCILILIAGATVMWRKWRGGYGRHINIPGDLTSISDDFERGAGPRRFSYKDLALATSNFTEGRKLGEGGFGRVYKGHLLDLDMPIAVKRFSSGSRQGKREYVTEVKIISMLRHRNLVRLIGWCHDQEEFLLVYEFMPNGSLDHHLFGRRITLGWTLRYKIALGLASSLLYLHEEWEQCVIHRDIKSSNVMLDSSFNAKLGDFGLARLMDHGIDPQTSGLAGTFGYMAPEYLSTRRASKESDVYSFGIVALEIATGRKSVELMNQKILVEWIWELYGNGELLLGVDERLKGNFEAKQVEGLMIVGLWCAHPDSALRPSIRQASNVLNFEAEWPQLPTEMPVAVYQPPHCIPSVSFQEPYTISSSINMGR